MYNIDSIADELTLALLFIALGIFVSFAVRSRSIKNFQFQISVFIIIWILGEIIGVLQNTNEMALLSPVIISTIMLLPDISLQIHVVSMIFLSSMLWIRFYYSEKSQKQLIDKITYSNDNSLF